MNASDAITSIAIALAISSMAACTGYAVVNKDRSQAEAIAACVASGGSWLSGPDGTQCTRPNTQTEQEKP